MVSVSQGTSDKGGGGGGWGGGCVGCGGGGGGWGVGFGGGGGGGGWGGVGWVLFLGVWVLGGCVVCGFLFRLRHPFAKTGAPQAVTGKCQGRDKVKHLLREEKVAGGVPPKKRGTKRPWRLSWIQKGDSPTKLMAKEAGGSQL